MVNASTNEWLAVWGILGVAILGLLYAVFLTRQILGEDTGTPQMREISESIRQGAVAYLSKQLRTIIIFIAILTVALFGSAALITHLPKYVTDAGFGSLQIALGRAGAFLMGSIFSLAVGQIGMRMAVLGNVRVAAAATRSLRDALRIGYRTGTITGMLTDGLGLLGGTIIFMIYGQAAPEVLLGFGFGGTLIALFMRVGGGIYTKAADVGADLVGKVEKDLPEDDPRNAAVIADLVGDNVGDCAGMAADIFESYEVTIVSAMILGIAVAMSHTPFEFKWILFPLAGARHRRHLLHHQHLLGEVGGRERERLRAHQARLQRRRGHLRGWLLDRRPGLHERLAGGRRHHGRHRAGPADQLPHRVLHRHRQVARCKEIATLHRRRPGHDHPGRPLRGHGELGVGGLRHRRRHPGLGPHLPG